MTAEGKEKARGQARRAVAKGDIVKSPCEVCGDTKVELHHDDYEKPLEVRMLCQHHHLELHARIERPIPTGPRPTLTLPPCKKCGGTGLGPPSGSDLKALRESAGVSVSAAARGMGCARNWINKVENGQDRAPAAFVAYYVRFEKDPRS